MKALETETLNRSTRDFNFNQTIINTNARNFSSNGFEWEQQSRTLLFLPSFQWKEYWNLIKISITKIVLIIHLSVDRKRKKETHRETKRLR